MSIVLILVLLLAGTAWAQEEITATENERLRAYAQEIKNDRDAKEAEIATMKVLLEKFRVALREARRQLEQAAPGGKEQ